VFAPSIMPLTVLKLVLHPPNTFVPV